MKLTRLIYIIITLFISQYAKCDVIFIPDTTHHVWKCVVITNLNNYPSISLVGVEKPVVGLKNCFLISNNCISQKYEGTVLYTYAVRTNYLLGKNLISIDWANDVNILKTSTILDVADFYVPNSYPLQMLDQGYTIMGFTDSSIVLYKSHEAKSFDDMGVMDSIFDYNYEGDTTSLLKEIPTPTVKNIPKYVKIVNISDYHGVSLIGSGLDVTNEYKFFVITNSSRIGENYVLNTLEVYAARTSYINHTGIYANIFDNNKNLLKADIEIKTYTDDYPEPLKISAIEEYYKIIGFTNENVVLWKFKEVLKAEDGSKDSVLLYDYEGDTTQLVQLITTPLNTTDIPQLSYVEIYPNPAGSSINIRLLNKYRGEVTLGIYSLDGKKMKSNIISVCDNNENIHLHVDDLTTGVYFIKIEMTGVMVTEKIVID